VFSFSAHAQSYPSGPVKVVIPFPAGSSTDLIGRAVAKMLSDGFEASFVAENRPGAQSTIGAAEVARSKPDGYTLLIGSSTSIAAAPFLLKRIPYKPLQDLAPVARVGAVPFVLVARPDLPVKSASDLIAYAHHNPGKLTWGYANAANQAAAATMTTLSNMNAVAIPYTGVPQMVVDMLGGRLDFGIIDTTNAAPQIKAGKLRALAVTSADELPQLPGVPPLGKTLNGYELLGWYGVYAPAGTPKSVIADIEKVLLKGMDTPGYRDALTHAGLIPFPADARELTRFGESETEKWAGMVKTAGIQPQ
jgi:tripartite-type tricarboxylate transporter receptor subunit TctC